MQNQSVQVGPVVGQGDGARQSVSVGNWHLTVFSTSSDEPRIRDLDLAERLGYARPYAIRDLIKRLLCDGKLRDVHIVRTVGKNPDGSRGRGRPGEEFWLTEAQALKVIAKSDQAAADAILDEMIEVFRLAIRGMLSPARASSAEVRMTVFLLEERQMIKRFLSDKLIFEVCRIYGYGHHPGNQPPQFFRKVAEKIYAAVFGAEVHDELRRRGDKRKYYELLTDNAHRMAKKDLAILETLARNSFTPAEFWMRVEAEFCGSALQGLLPIGQA